MKPNQQDCLTCPKCGSTNFSEDEFRQYTVHASALPGGRNLLCSRRSPSLQTPRARQAQSRRMAANSAWSSANWRSRSSSIRRTNLFSLASAASADRSPWTGASGSRSQLAKTQLGLGEYPRSRAPRSCHRGISGIVNIGFIAGDDSRPGPRLYSRGRACGKWRSRRRYFTVGRWMSPPCVMIPNP